MNECIYDCWMLLAPRPDRESLAIFERWKLNLIQELSLLHSRIHPFWDTVSTWRYCTVGTSLQLHHLVSEQNLNAPFSASRSGAACYFWMVSTMGYTSRSLKHLPFLGHGFSGISSPSPSVRTSCSRTNRVPLAAHPGRVPLDNYGKWIT